MFTSDKAARDDSMRVFENSSLAFAVISSVGLAGRMSFADTDTAFRADWRSSIDSCLCLGVSPKALSKNSSSSSSLDKKPSNSS